MVNAIWQPYFEAVRRKDLLAAFDAMVGVGVMPVPLSRDSNNKVKKPVGKDWGKQSIDHRRNLLVSTIRKEPQNAGIGCQPFGYIVFDLDPPDKDPNRVQDIIDDFMEIVMGGEHHETMIVTSERGVHVWFEADEEFQKLYGNMAKQMIMMPSGGHIEVFCGSKSGQTQVACAPSEGKRLLYEKPPCPLPETVKQFLLDEERKFKGSPEACERKEIQAAEGSWETEWFLNRANKILANIERAEGGTLHYTLRRSVNTIAGYAAGMGCEFYRDVVFEFAEKSLVNNGGCESFKAAKKTMLWAWGNGIAYPLMAPEYEKQKGKPAPSAQIDLIPYYDPFFVAQQFVESEGDSRCVTWKGSSWQWKRGRYVDLKTEEIKAKIGSFTDHWFLVNAEQELQTIDDPIARAKFRKKPVTSSVIQSVSQAFTSVTTINEEFLESMPGWIDRRNDDWEPSETIALNNCLLNVRTTETRPLTNRWFSKVRSGVTWNDGEMYCPNWFDFLRAAFQDDPESILILKMFFGLCLTSNTSFQKILALIGPPRSGKGTISRTLTSLIGQDSVASLGLGDMCREFGLEKLIGTPLAIMPDVRFGNRENVADAVERLLSISGEDEIRIARKYQPDWSGKLPTRIMIASNEMPRLPDSAAALPTRMIVLQFRESFIGKEDLNLQDRINGELSGILKWAVQGYQLLLQSGKFPENDSTRSAILDAQESGSPVVTFVSDYLDITYDPSSMLEVGQMYDSYKIWCEQTGHKAYSQTALLKQVLDQHPKLKTSRPGGREQSRKRVLTGVSLNHVGKVAAMQSNY